MPKICGLTTQARTIAAFMVKPLNRAAAKGFECYAISSPDVDSRLTPECLGQVTHIPVKIKWGYMTPFQLISTIYNLYKVFRREKFDIIQYATMNAALCSSIAGWLARVPIRINLLWGLDYVQFKGWKRALYFTATKLTCRLSTRVQPDSKGNLRFGREQGLFDEAKSELIYNGSACGLDLKKFDISKREQWRKEIRDELGLNKYSTVLGFVGAVYLDKGINETLEAFMSLERDDVALVLVGGFERIHTLKQDILQRAKNRPNIYFLGRKPDPQRYYASFDFLVLASYAEGFGMVVLEAAGVGTPAIISNIKGPTDLIEDDVNGFICNVRSSESLAEAMKKAITIEPSEYERLSNSAFEIAKRDYDSEAFLQKYVENRIKLYNTLTKS